MPLPPFNRCPVCGAVVPEDSPDGSCSRCLLQAAMQPTEPEDAPRHEAPSLAAVSAAFPQLEILELIGHGGMGAVFKARQPKLDRLVALKLLPASLAERDAAFAGRFEREGRLLARLHHPNIVAVHDSGTAGGFFYLLMEFVEGVNLRQAMRSRRFTPAQALAIVPHICDALQFAHEEGVLHRDIKPENILLDAKGRVKLADFGIAKLLGDATEDSHGNFSTHDPHLTQAGSTLGTPSYMAPEQRDTPGAVDHRADIYSLGVVFYELLTGELPVGKFAPPSALSAADPRVDAIVQQALEKERDLRQHSADEVKTQVHAMTQTPAPAKRATMWPGALVVGCVVVFAIILAALGRPLLDAITERQPAAPAPALLEKAIPAQESVPHSDLESIFAEYEQLLIALREATFELDLADFAEGSETERQTHRADIKARCDGLAEQTAKLQEKIRALGKRAAGPSDR